VAHPSVDWRLEQQVVNCFRSLGVDEETSRYETELVSELLEADDHGGKVNLRELVVEAAHRESTRRFFKVNVYDGVAWLNKERFEDFIEYLALTVMIKELSRLAKRISSRSRTSLKKIAGSVTEIEDLALKANYRLEDFISALNAD